MVDRVVPVKQQAGVAPPSANETSALKQEIARLDAMITAKIDRLKSRMARPYTLRDLEDDAAELTRLIRSRKFKSEIADGLK